MEDIVNRLETRALIRRMAINRKSVQEGKPDRISDLLEEASQEILILRNRLVALYEVVIDEYPSTDGRYIRAEEIYRECINH